MIDRKPPASETARDYLDLLRGQDLGDDWLKRHFRLRRARILLPILSLHPNGKGYYVATEYIEMSKSARYVTFDQLREEIIAAEKALEARVA